MFLAILFLFGCNNKLTEADQKIRCAYYLVGYKDAIINHSVTINTNLMRKEYEQTMNYMPINKNIYLAVYTNFLDLVKKNETP
jgi:hypothetical protein